RLRRIGQSTGHAVDQFRSVQRPSSLRHAVPRTARAGPSLLTIWEYGRQSCAPTRWGCAPTTGPPRPALLPGHSTGRPPRAVSRSRFSAASAAAISFRDSSTPACVTRPPVEPIAIVAALAGSKPRLLVTLLLLPPAQPARRSVATEVAMS